MSSEPRFELPKIYRALRQRLGIKELHPAVHERLQRPNMRLPLPRHRLQINILPVLKYKAPASPPGPHCTLALELGPLCGWV